MQFLGFQVILKRIKAIRFMMKDKSVSFWKKALVVLGLAYLVWPIDLIPTVIPVVGLLDDIVLWWFILWYLKEELDKYWLGGKTVDLSKKYRGKTIIDDVKFEVKDKDSK